MRTRLMIAGIFTLLTGCSHLSRAPADHAMAVEVATAAHIRSRELDSTDVIIYRPTADRRGYETPGLRTEPHIAAVREALGGPERALLCETPSPACASDNNAGSFIFSNLSIRGDSASLLVSRVRVRGDRGSEYDTRYELRRTRKGWVVVKAELERIGELRRARPRY